MENARPDDPGRAKPRVPHWLIVVAKTLVGIFDFMFLCWTALWGFAGSRVRRATPEASMWNARVEEFRRRGKSFPASQLPGQGRLYDVKDNGLQYPKPVILSLERTRCPSQVHLMDENRFYNWGGTESHARIDLNLDEQEKIVSYSASVWSNDEGSWWEER